MGKVYKKAMGLNCMAEKGSVLFDSIDLKILELLRKRHNTTFGGLKVYEIAKELKIRHKSLKPHIDKLRSLNLIVPVASDKEVWLSTRSVYWDELGSDLAHEISKKALEEVNKELELEEKVFEILQKARTYYWNKKADKLLEMDLRKARTQENGLEVVKPKELHHKKSGNTNKNKGKRKK